MTAGGRGAAGAAATQVHACAEASTLSAVTATRSDEELLAAWRAGDRQAGELLFERYYEPVARFFLNKTDASAELIQQTFLACVEGAPRFRGEGSFRSFLFAIAYRQLCKHYRDRRGERVDLAEVSVAAMEPSPSQVLVEGEELRLLLAGLRRIPVDCQVVLELLYWEELTTVEMAAVLRDPGGHGEVAATTRPRAPARGDRGARAEPRARRKYPARHRDVGERPAGAGGPAAGPAKKVSAPVIRMRPVGTTADRRSPAACPVRNFTSSP